MHHSLRRASTSSDGYVSFLSPVFSCRSSVLLKTFPLKNQIYFQFKLSCTRIAFCMVACILFPQTPKKCLMPLRHVFELYRFLNTTFGNWTIFLFLLHNFFYLIYFFHSRSLASFYIGCRTSSIRYLVHQIPPTPTFKNN